MDFTALEQELSVCLFVCRLFVWVLMFLYFFPEERPETVRVLGRWGLQLYA